MFVVVFQLLWICFPAFQRALNPVVFTKMERLKLWDLLDIQNCRCLAFRSSPDVSCSVHWREVTLGTYLIFLMYCVPSRNPFVSSFDACLQISCCCCCCWVWSSREINTLCGENVASGLICCCSYWPSTWVQAERTQTDGLLDRQTVGHWDQGEWGKILPFFWLSFALHCRCKRWMCGRVMVDMCGNRSSRRSAQFMVHVNLYCCSPSFFFSILFHFCWLPFYGYCYSMDCALEVKWQGSAV